MVKSKWWRLIAALALFACRTPTDSLERAPADVQEFLAVDAAGPFHGGTRIASPNPEVQLYYVSYGPKQDCPSGCFYNRALLMKASGRIGWVEGFSRAPSRAIYQMQAQDSAVFTLPFFDALLLRDRAAHGEIGKAFYCSGHMPQSMQESMNAANPNTASPLYCRR